MTDKYVWYAVADPWDTPIIHLREDALRNAAEA